jgi:PAS domain S-box-containing protein
LKKVLLIDDDQRFLQATARVLLTHGYRVEEASDGLEGLQMALQDPPDVVVVDLIMPRVGGSELVSFFRQNPYLAGVPIILLSGVLIESAAVVEELSVDFVLSKGPFEETMRLLLSGLDDVGNGARGRKAITPRPGIHERRQVVELLNIKRDLASVLEGAAAGILEMDTKGRVTYANAGAEELLGIGRGSLIGTDILSVFPKAALANFQALLSRFDEDTGPTSRGMTSVVDDRALRTILTSVWKEDMRQSIVVTLFEVAHDVEAQNRPHQLLRYLSHEMRSSLLIIERYLRSLVTGSVVGQDGEASRADQVGILSFLAQETARLQRLLGEASKFHRTLRELPDISMGPIDLVSLIKDSISGITALAVPRGIDVSYRGPSLAPKIRGDHDKLVQVLYNLLLNALKFTPQGGSVWVELQVSDGEMLTTVADTGRGIPSEELKEILAQAQRPELFLSQNEKRVGLGLSISFQIVRAHRGRLSAESRVGAGSRFSFALPLEVAGAAEQCQLPYRSSAG